MQHQIDKSDAHGFEIRPKFAEIGEDRILGSAWWFDEGGNRHERHVVLTIRDDRIADMQVCGTLRQAKRFARRAA